MHPRFKERELCIWKKRSEYLKLLGFASYGAYLKSELWNSIRQRVFERDGGKCRLCGKVASQVHHTTYDYETLGGYKLDKMYSSCAGCHRHVSIKPNGKRRNFFQTLGITELRLRRQTYDNDSLLERMFFETGE